MRKLIILLLALVPFLASAASFSDLSPYHTYAEAINNLVERNIISGYPDGTFRPSDPINRAEFMKLVVASLNTSLDSNFYKNCYPDVAEEWYAPYVCYGNSYGIVQGYPDGTFKPTQNVLYSEALKMLYLAYNDPGKLDTIGTEWYAPYLEDARFNKLDLGLNPAQKMTRGEVAQLVWNMLSYKLPNNVLSAEDKVYTNTDYGFSLTLTNNWAGYEATVTPVETEGSTTVANISFGLPELWETAFPYGSNFSDDLFTITVRTKAWGDQFADCDDVEIAPANCILLASRLGSNDSYIFTWSSTWATTSPHALFDSALADLSEIIDSFEVTE